MANYSRKENISLPCVYKRKQNSVTFLAEGQKKVTFDTTTFEQNIFTDELKNERQESMNGWD